MLHYTIRLDDACPFMHKEKWFQVETILEQYDIQPIVGIIPDSKDQTFAWSENTEFWTNTVARYIKKNWIIAQHGCHHLYQKGTKSEFIGLTYEEQKNLIYKGNCILKEHGVIPTCFFAPAHTFDDITIDVCRDSGFFRFISDGQALYPYQYRGMNFLPALFDTPRAISPFGIFTFILHPNQMTNTDFKRLINFCNKYKKRFLTTENIFHLVDTKRKRNIFERTVGVNINFARKLRKYISSSHKFDF
jgi:hypothetical protein